MRRAVFAFPVAVATALAGFAGTGIAHAGPPPPCTFTLSPPHVVQVDGVSLVTATVAPADCGPPATAANSVACLQMQGGGQAKTCFQSGRRDTAQVFVGPYHPGATYVATGRGCGAWIGQEPAPDCQLLGPVTATL